MTFAKPFIGLVAIAALAAACAQPPGPGGPGRAAPEGGFETRAIQVAQAWRAANLGDAFVPMQDLTLASGFATAEMKVAFLSGWYTTSVALPTAAATGIIRWADGSTKTVALHSAADAYKAIDLGDPGPGAAALVVTGASLGTMSIRTSRGMAEVPAWKFAIKDNPGPVLRAAVAPAATTPLPSPGRHDLNAQLVVAHDLSGVGINTIDYRLGVGACDKEITAKVWESADIVVLGGTARQPGPAETCIALLVLHPVKVTLAAPVGNRVILDAISGHPVSLGSGNAPVG